MYWEKKWRAIGTCHFQTPIHSNFTFSSVSLGSSTGQTLRTPGAPRTIVWETLLYCNSKGKIRNSSISRIRHCYSKRLIYTIPNLSIPHPVSDLGYKCESGDILLCGFNHTDATVPSRCQKCYCCVSPVYTWIFRFHNKIFSSTFNLTPVVNFGEIRSGQLVKSLISSSTPVPQGSFQIF